MSKHTPGPWAIGSGNISNRIVEPSRERTVATFQAPGRSGISAVEENAEADANGRLIAAAPEMYALLKRVAQWHDASWDANDRVAQDVTEEVAEQARTLLTRINKEQSQ